MAGVLQHLRSSTLDKRPNPASMVDGQVAINYASGSPGMFFKDSNGNLVKVGPVHVGATAPNVSPASGGTAGNSKGEQWLDTSGGTYVFKIWDGSAWRSEAGEFVNTTGDTMTGSLTMGASADIIFEGSVDDGFETTLTVVNPTADRTITLPNVTGTVVTTGDSGTVTSTMIADGTIVNADVNASAAIAGTKIAPNFGSQTVQTTGVFSAASGSASAPSIAFTGDTNTGIYSPGTDQVAISTNGTGRLSVDANGNVAVDTNTLYVDAVNNEVGVGTTNPSATAHVQTTSQFSSASGNTSAGLLVSQSGGTPAEGAYGTAITLSKINSTRPGGAIASVQTTADDDQLGLAFLVHSSSVANDTLTEALRISHAGTATFTASSSTAPFIANIGASEVARIDSSGRLLVGTPSTPPAVETIVPKFVSSSAAVSTGAQDIAIYNYQNAGGSGRQRVGPKLLLGNSRSGTNGSLGGIVVSGDQVGNIRFAGDDGSAFLTAAEILAEVDGTPGADDMPGRLVFSTTADGASSPTERMRIDSDGGVGIGGIAASSTTLRLVKNITGATSAFALNADGQIQSDVTSDVSYFRTSANTVDAAFSLGSLTHYQAAQGTVTGGTRTAPTNQYGFWARASLTGATNNYGFYSDIASGTGRWNFYANGTADSYFASSNFIWANGGTERARIDSSGRLLMGTSTAYVGGGNVNSRLQIHGLDGSNSGLQGTRWSDNNGSSWISLQKSRGTSVGSRAIVLANDVVGALDFAADDGTNFVSLAKIDARVDGTPGTDDMPGRIVLSTTADGAASPTERLRITNDGVICYDQAAPVSYAAAATLVVGDLKNGLIQYTGAAATLTLPTGTLTEGGFAANSLYNNITFEWSVINTGSGTCTIGAGTAHTIVGGATVAAGDSGRFASRRTAANTFVSYRLS